MATLNNLTTGQFPVPAALSAAALRSGATDSTVPAGTLDALYTGQTSGVPLALNELLVDLANAAAFGGAAPAVASGFVLTAGSGLTLNVAAGLGVANWLIPYEAAGTLVVADAVRTHVWLKTDGTLVGTTATTTPTGGAVYLGSALAAGAAITEVCDSGVVRIRGGILWRRSNDVGRPTDAPPASLCLVTQTQAGSYLWDGAQHRAIGSSGDLGSVSFSTDADFALTAAQFASAVIEIGGSITAGRAVSVPNVAGAQRTIKNNTGQTVTVKVAGETGVAIATAKRAIVYCDGTDIRRVTADE